MSEKSSWGIAGFVVVVVVLMVFAGVAEAVGVKEVKQLTFLGEATHPSFSPDGKEIVFVWDLHPRCDGRGPYKWIWIINTNDSSASWLNLTKFDEDYWPREELTRYSSARPLNFTNFSWERSKCSSEEVVREVGVVGSSPLWSPDGTKIAFVRSGSIYTMDTDGSNITKIANGTGGLSWSPDGSIISYVDENYKISVMYRDGSNRTQIFPWQVGYVSTPKWSPDGTKLAFSWGGLCPKIYILNTSEILDILHQVKSIYDVRPTSPIAGGICAFSLTWSPDSSMIAFPSNLDWIQYERRGEMYTGSMETDFFAVDVRNGELIRLHDAEPYYSTPSWSPDGKIIAFHSDSGASHISLLILDSNASSEIVPLPTSTPVTPAFELLTALAAFLLIYILRRRKP
jgi:Tol biopolymer transport system component